MKPAHASNLIALLLLPAQLTMAQAPATQRPSTAPIISLARRYHPGESLNYHMQATNQGRTATIRYEADAVGLVHKQPSGSFAEDYAWANLRFNDNPIALPASEFRQQLSLDPALPPSVPDLSKANPMLIGPITDLLTFYADLWLAIKLDALHQRGDHQYVPNGSANSWADGVHTVIGQDSIDFDLTLIGVNLPGNQAQILVRHVPPPKPQVTLPAKWMESPVADTPNNWVEVTKEETGKYLAEVGKETFDVELTISQGDGKILSATMGNPVSVLARECHDAALTECGQPQRYQIKRQIQMRLAP